MTPSPLSSFGMDTITLAGPLETKLAVMKAAGFSQVMLKSDDLCGHPQGVDTAQAAVRASGLRATGFQVLRDFEGLPAPLHAYKIEIAKAMLRLCAGLGGDVLLVCSSTSPHASEDREHLARDLRKLAMLALPLGIRIAYEALSWGRTINEFPDAWDIVCRADCPNLGLGIDAYHLFASATPLARLDELVAEKIFLVQLSDFMWQHTASFEERKATARSFRVFPGEGVHSHELSELVLRLDALGYRGDYSFEVFNDDYVNLPPPMVAERARASALWLAEDVLRLPAPLPVGPAVAE